MAGKPILDVSQAVVFKPEHGIQFTPPPLEHIPTIRASVEKIIAGMTPGKKVAIIGVANTDEKGQININAVFVYQKETGPLNWKVGAWGGKKWGKPIEAGAMIIMEM